MAVAATHSVAEKRTRKSLSNASASAIAQLERDSSAAQQMRARESLHLLLAPYHRQCDSRVAQVITTHSRNHSRNHNCMHYQTPSQKTSRYTAISS